MLPPGIRLIDFPDYSKIVSSTKAPISFLKENFKALQTGSLPPLPKPGHGAGRSGKISWDKIFYLSQQV
jgi:hypothetical protein